MKTSFEYTGLEVMTAWAKEQVERMGTDMKEGTEPSIQALGINMQVSRVVKEMTLLYINMAAHGDQPVQEVEKRVMAWNRFLNEFFPDVGEEIYDLGRECVDKDSALWNWSRLWEACKYRNWKVRDEWNED